jgi:hypothetical protein
MRRPPRGFSLPALVLLVSCGFAGTPAATAADPPPAEAGGAAKALLAATREAAGGAAWERVRGIHAHGQVETGGLAGTAESWADLATGRYLDRWELGPVKGATGFDGETAWLEDASGQARPEQGEDGRQAAANESYRRALGYWFPERHPAAVEPLGEREEGGRRFHVLRLTPRGGRPFELWLDAVTLLVDRTVEPGATQTQTVFYSDYRDVEGVKLPFASRTSTGDPRYDVVARLDAVTLGEPLAAARFAMPAPPAADFAFAGGATSTTVPIDYLNRHLYVPVKLNGKGPYRVLFDTGGMNIVTPELAAALGLKTAGSFEGRGVGEKSEEVSLVTIDTLEVGKVTLRNQLFAVFPLNGSFADAEGFEQFGIIGYEVAKRLVVEIDYQDRRLTLTQPEAFREAPGGIAVPFEFDGHTPLLAGSIDGIAGQFDIDTGSRSSLDLMGPFVERHGLAARYAPRVEAVTGWGVGGAARSRVGRAGVLRLGNVEVAAPLVELTLQKQGAFTDRYAAGNVGNGILERFHLTLDYPRQRLVFRPNARAAERDVFDRSGMWLNRSGEAFEVVDVVTGGAADAAGLRAGDRVLAVDGHATALLPLPELRERFRSDPPGTALRLLVDSGGMLVEVELALKELV